MVARVIMVTPLLLVALLVPPLVAIVALAAGWTWLAWIAAAFGFTAIMVGVAFRDHLCGGFDLGVWNADARLPARLLVSLAFSSGLRMQLAGIDGPRGDRPGEVLQDCVTP